MRKRITKRAVEAIAPGARPEFLWDTGLPGFGIEVTSRGGRIDVLQYRYGGRTRRYTTGRTASILRPTKRAAPTLTHREISKARGVK